MLFAKNCTMDASQLEQNRADGFNVYTCRRYTIKKLWEKEKFWPAEEKRNKGGINLGKGNIWSTEGVKILPKEKLLWAGGTTHI